PLADLALRLHREDVLARRQFDRPFRLGRAQLRRRWADDARTATVRPTIYQQTQGGDRVFALAGGDRLDLDLTPGQFRLRRGRLDDDIRRQHLADVQRLHRLARLAGQGQGPLDVSARLAQQELESGRVVQRR